MSKEITAHFLPTFMPEEPFSVKYSIQINVTLYILFHNFAPAKVIIVEKMNF